jgi:hypothetical protein
MSNSRRLGLASVAFHVIGRGSTNVDGTAHQTRPGFVVLYGIV